MTKDIEHVHGNIKIKLAKFLSKQFANILFIVFKIFFLKQKLPQMKYLYLGPHTHHGKLTINLWQYSKKLMV